ncbi:hypothetical protein [Catellatospora chokoriensis]|jgi:hypothetical protein|uniref:Uncharacterized protein n=1 Tax=Catellatospora chokoriensis TaxID=310353 RepID=A0A8J3KB58_9ACTN|nr:hypothetical protein [Catellatospora chokoriensis]GIF94020.1 hypothetical protein Cch02nite_74640 [Catellatospora chokoriensis]
MRPDVPRRLAARPVDARRGLPVPYGHAEPFGYIGGCLQQVDVATGPLVDDLIARLRRVHGG